MPNVLEVTGKTGLDQSILDFKTLKKIDRKMLIRLLNFFVDTGTELVSYIGLYIYYKCDL